MTSPAYLALSLSQVVKTRLITPMITNTVMNPADTAVPTASARRTVARCEPSGAAVDAEEVQEVRRQQHEPARVHRARRMPVRNDWVKRTLRSNISRPRGNASAIAASSFVLGELAGLLQHDLPIAVDEQRGGQHADARPAVDQLAVRDRAAGGSRRRNRRRTPQRSIGIIERC